MKITENLLVKGLTNKPLNSVKGIVIHWVANPNTSAARNRQYWENLASGVSAHYIIDLNGDILQCVPDKMVAYQVGCPRGYTKAALSRLSSYPNNCVVGIECTHLDWDGKMTNETYESLVQLSAKLLKDNKLTVNDLWLHSEIVGKDYKDCHRWFSTTKPEDWGKFKQEVNTILNPPKQVVQPVTPVKPLPKQKPVLSSPMKLTYTRLLKLGSEGSDVGELQEALNKLYFKCGKVDKTFGNLTKDAVTRFQKVHLAYEVDGMAGKHTISKINELL